jgi:hypothetical protein
MVGRGRATTWEGDDVGGRQGGSEGDRVSAPECITKRPALWGTWHRGVVQIDDFSFVFVDNRFL